MKIKIIFIAICSVVLIGCGSGKNVVKSAPKKVIVVANEEHTIKLPQLEQINKNIKKTPKNTSEYILKYAAIAIKKMHEHKIPASITLAQGVLESGSGRSVLAQKSNNHFGIKCHKGWQGNTVEHDDDEKGECFRKYKYPEQSYEDHSQFLLTRSRYAHLFKLKHTNYKGWAYGLKNAGYATDSRYPQKLIGIIKKYNLHQYDKVSPKKGTSSAVVISETYHQVIKGETLYSVSKKYNTTVKNIQKLNGLRDNTISIGQKLKVK